MSGPAGMIAGVAALASTIVASGLDAVTTTRTLASTSSLRSV